MKNSEGIKFIIKEFFRNIPIAISYAFVMKQLGFSPYNFIYWLIAIVIGIIVIFLRKYSGK
jgi:hypothetical protein